MNYETISGSLVMGMIFPVWSYWIIGVAGLMVLYFWLNQFMESIPPSLSTAPIRRGLIPIILSTLLGFSLVQFIRGTFDYQVFTHWNPFERTIFVFFSILLYPHLLPKR